MTSIKTFAALAAGAAVLSAGGLAHAQTPYGQNQPQSTGQQVLGQILQSVFGNQSTGTVDEEWSRGRRPLGANQSAFDNRLQDQVRAGALQSWSADRIRNDYTALVQQEARYGQDGRFTTQERQDLTARYNALATALNQGGYGEDPGGYQSVAEGRAEFERRVDAAVYARRLSRTAATRLRTDYAALIRTEADYQRGGLTARERQEIETRLDALDARVGDVGYAGGGAAQQSPRDRLAAVERALSGLARDALADRIRVQHGDLTRLEAAYARVGASADDRAYLDRRIGELEVQARVRR